MTGVSLRSLVQSVSLFLHLCSDFVMSKPCPPQIAAAHIQISSAPDPTCSSHRLSVVAELHIKSFFSHSGCFCALMKVLRSDLCFHFLALVT